MITAKYEREVVTYYGLSTDTKPAAGNGDAFIEMDTGKVYFYDAESDWTEWGA